MPDPYKLSFLTKFRKRQNITLDQMALYCGLTGTRSRISVGKWESGETSPRKSHRPQMLDYMVRYLKLDIDDLVLYWGVIQAEWMWDELSKNEIDLYFLQNNFELNKFRIPRQLPPAVIPEFFLRKEPYENILNNLLELKICCINGGPGMGKTQLASKIVWTIWEDDALRARFPDGIIYFSFSENTTLNTFFEHIIATYQGRPRWDLKKAATEVLTGREALIYVDAIEFSNNSLDEFAEILGVNSLLATSRSSHIGANSFPVNEFTNNEALQLIDNISPSIHLDNDKSIDLFDKIGKSPLAISVIAKHLNLIEGSPSDYIDNITQKRGLSDDEKLSKKLFAFINVLSQGEKELLSLLSCLAFAPFEVSILENSFEKEYYSNSLALLIKHGFIYLENNKLRFSHALIYQYAKSIPHNRTGVLAIQEHVLDRLQKASHVKNNKEIGKLYLHALTFIYNANKEKSWQVILDYVETLNSYLDLGGYWTDWLEISNLAYQAALKQSMFELAGYYLHKIGVAYNLLGKSEEALDYYEKALEQVTSPIRKSRILCDIGLSYRDIGDFDKSLNTYKQGLEISIENNDLSGQADHLCNMGVLVRKQGHVDVAFEYASQALHIRKELGAYNKIHADYGSLGLIYRDLGEKEKAIEHLQEALRICQDVGDKKEESVHLVNLATIFSRDGNVEESLNLLKKALDIDTSIGDRVGEGIDLYNIAVDYIKLTLQYITRAHEIFIATKHPYAKDTEEALLKTEKFLNEVS